MYVKHLQRYIDILRYNVPNSVLPKVETWWTHLFLPCKSVNVIPPYISYIDKIMYVLKIISKIFLLDKFLNWGIRKGTSAIY